MATKDRGNFAGKVAFVTGAAKGIGRAAALAFAREKAVLLSVVYVMGLTPTTSLAQDTNTMKIRFTIDGKELATATLLNNATARDLLNLLPLTVTLEDYAAAEKIAYLPRKLSTAGAPAGTDPSVGDIAYYAPWGNLAIFYKDAGYARGLLPLGRVDSSIEVLRAADRSKVTIQRAAQ